MRRVPQRRNELQLAGDAAESARDDALDALEAESAKEEKLKVVVRVRPLQKSEEPWGSDPGDPNGDLERDSRERSNASVTPTGSSSLSIQDNHVMWEKNGQLKILAADAVFPGSAPQHKVFESVRDCVDGLFAGYDCSVFAYGQTGTGKTYTMSGVERVRDDAGADVFALKSSYGVVPRGIEKLFARMEHERASASSVSFGIYCSFIEIYNEKIYDILSVDAPPPSGDAASGSAHTKNAKDARGDSGAVTHRAGWNCAKAAKEAPSLQIRQKLDGSVFVDGLTSRNLTSPLEMLQAFREGSMNREVRDNLYNQHSSRGHSIFQITLRKSIVAADAGGSSPGRGSRTAPQSRLSRLFFVDLAGSEKWHVNGSDLSDKYAGELASINRSLSALTNCVLALTQKERTHVPFRDSVLTRLLRSCLQGEGRTAFVVTVSPAKESLEESFATLRFAERLKALRCRPVRKKVFSNDHTGDQRLYYEQQIQTMRLEVTRLRDLLRKAQRKNGDLVESSFAAANSALVEENRRLKELLMNSERTRLVERGERMAGKGGAVSYATDSAGAHALKQSAKASPGRAEEVTSDSAIGTGASAKPVRNQPQVASSGARARRADDAKRSRIPEALADDDSADADADADASSEFDRSMQQMGDLLSSLHSKEARLHWMLEAEMEARSTKQAPPPSSSLPAAAAGGEGGGLPAQPPDSDSEPRRPTVTRMWAVEKRLRSLVQVPPPLRSGAQISSSSPVVSSASSAVRSLEGSVQVATTAQHPVSSAPTPLAAQAGRSARPISSRDDDALNSLTLASAKLDSPRQPVRAVPALSSSVAAADQRGGRVAASSSSSSRTLAQSATEFTTPSKSAAILRLVGAGAGGEKLGKSKEELVDEYKRARRAELEAMLRTMVHK